jgi:methanethiol S-methyltransferase
VSRSTRLSGPLAFASAGAVLFALSLLYFLYSYLVRFGGPADGRATALRAIGIDVLLFTAFAAHHSLLARTPLKNRIQRMLPSGLERSTYTWVASVLFLMVCGWWQPVPGELYRLTGVSAWPGFAMQALGIVLTARSSARLDVLDLAGVRPVLRARRSEGTAPVHLETRGLYGFVRHPLYFGWVLFVFGAPHMTLTRFVFATVSTMYLALAIPLEERSLIHAFGADYRAYQQKVRWRMIPGVY